MEMESMQERPWQPMATLQPKVFLPHRKDKVKERVLFSGGILEAHSSALFTSCPFSARAIVNKGMDRQRTWDLLPFQNLATACVSFYCTLCGRTHSKDVTTSHSLLGGMQRQGRLKDEAYILPGAREYCNEYEQVFLVFLFTIMIHSYSRIHSSPPPLGLIHGIV